MSGNSTLDARKLQLIIDQVDNLPTLPAVATRLLALAASEDSSVRDLTEIIDGDPALTSRILALVNSAGFSRGNVVSSVSRATALLGFEAIRNSVLSLKVFDHFNRRPGPTFNSRFDRTGFWKHSLGVGAASHMLARRVRGVNPEEAFVAGLLHDVGKVALDFALPKTFDQVVRRVQARRIAFCDAELSILGVDHMTVGHRLATNWQFPETLANVIWLHHQCAEHLPSDIAGRQLVEVVHVADLLVRRERIGAGSPPSGHESVDEAVRGLGLEAEHLESVGKALRAVVAEQVKVMGLEDADEKDLFYQSVQSANSELGRINEQLAAARRMLERQKRHAEALATLARGTYEAQSMGDLQSAMAREFMTWLDSATCVVYCSGPEVSHVEGTVARRGRRQGERFLFEAGGPDWNLPAGDGSPQQYGLARAEQSHGWLFERLGERMGHGAFYSYPLWAGDRTLGAIVFSWAEDRPAPSRAEADSLASLAATAGAAIVAWQRRERLADLTQNLAEANRAAYEAREELIKRRSLASIGAMAAGAAHEINNPLAVVSGRAQMLAEGETDEKKRKALDIICQQAERASGIVSELMAFARPLATARRMTDLATLLRKTGQRLHQQAEEQRVALTVEMGPDLPPACIDGAQVAWAIEELVRNAVTATAPGGRVTIAAEHDDAGNLLTVTVTDTGCGMDTETLERACDPFFSGRHSDKRQGLGLAKVQRIAEANKTSFHLDSSVDQGTTARLVFDLADQPQQADTPAREVV